jgi:transcription-repair coupling factor (superfamily II helicase)
MFQSKNLEFLKKSPQNIVVENYEEALNVAEVAKYLNIDFVLFPDFRANEGDDLRSYKNELFELNTALFNYYQKKSIFISPINTILRTLPTAKNFDSFKIEFADTINLESLKEKLFLWGYEFVNIIQEKGEVSFRGDIIDIYPINSQNPIRISLFDDEVENIREFDEFTQKSSNEIENFTIIPAISNLT